MKAFFKRFKGEDREREHREKAPPPPPPKLKADDSWLKHASAPPASFSLPPTRPPLPATPTTAPVSQAPTPPPMRAPSPLPAPAPAPSAPVIPPLPPMSALVAPTPTPTPAPPAPAPRPPSPPADPPATHSTASSRPSQQSEHTTPDSAARRKVAFRSPALPPISLPDPETPSRAVSPASTQQTTTTTYYRMRPTSAARFAAQQRDTPDSARSTPPRINTAATSRATVGRSNHSPTHSTRTFGPAAADQASMTIRSGTPYSHMSGVSAIQAAASWSEAAENDLVNNLGPRERTRQEVLWEIVASEERYVGEIIKLKETFIDPLLHPFAPAPSLYHQVETTTILDDDRTSLRRAASPAESLDHLPIAARFLSGTPAPGPSSTSTHQTRAETPRYKSQAPTIGDADSYDSDDEDKFGGNQRRRGTPSGGRSPYGTAAQRRTGSGKVPVPFPARSQQSLPQPRGAASTHSLGRQSVAGGEQLDGNRSGAVSALKRFQRRVGSGTPRGDSISGVG
ncbi:hypothetical protein FRC09_011342, partial [Ceratobasidium sp. 395]